MDNRFKTQLCRFFKMDNSCNKGDQCQYAHGMQELNGNGNSNNFNGGYNNGNNQNRQFNNNPTNLLKTKICKFWQDGNCKFEQNCRYAHGEQDLNKNGGNFNNNNQY